VALQNGANALTSAATDVAVAFTANGREFALYRARIGISLSGETKQGRSVDVHGAHDGHCARRRLYRLNAPCGGAVDL